MATQDRRQAELAKIHIAAKELGMDDEQYRAVLWTVARVDSAKDLDSAGRAAVLDHLRSRGFKSAATGQTRKRPYYPGVPHNIDNDEQLRKIEALLADMGLSWSYADAIAKRMWKVERVAWVRSWPRKRAIITALTYEQRKRGLLQRIDECLEILGKDRSYVEQQLNPELRNKANWQRNINALSRIRQRLEDEVIYKRTGKRVTDPHVPSRWRGTR